MASVNPLYKNFGDVLKGAKQGEVKTRFPPEPSGYLHIGHIKACMLNYHYAKIYGGKMLLRYDDTNPMNEKLEFVENISRDLKTMDIIPDEVSHTSDFFPEIQKYMEKLITDGNAYADNGTAEEMKDQRDNGFASPHRDMPKEETLKKFHDMLVGTAPGWCIRGRMNHEDKYKCLRDPVFYRTKEGAHHRHGTTYKAYPCYDFACPIVDSIEGITHALRSIEYHDRNGGYVWVQKVLGLRPVVIYDFSRLNLVSTILSKRSLKWFCEEGIVDGWSDPRFPTVQGIMRRGMTPPALVKFMLEQGPSKNTNLMEWDKIWAYNKDVIDPIAPRYTAIVKETSAKIIIDNVPETIRAETHPLHQKNASLGEKAVLYGRELLVEHGDAVDVAVGEKITLMKWGNATITSSETVDGQLVLHGNVDPADKDFKKTKKLTWIAVDSNTNFEVTLVELDHLITKKKVEENEKVQDIVNRDSRFAYTAIAEGNMKSLQVGDKIQLERRGYFIVDQIFGADTQMTLNFIPDGKSKNMSKIQSKLDQAVVSGGKADAAVAASKAKQKAQGKQAAGADGEVKLSKKELNKLAKKNQKAAAKAGQPVPAGAAKAKKEVEVQYNTRSTELSANLNRIEKALGNSQFINGSAPTSSDKEGWEQLKNDSFSISPLTHPNVFAWYGLVSHFSEQNRNSWPQVSAPATQAAAPKVEAKVDDDLDLFGDDDDEDAAAAVAAAKANAAKAKKPKKVVIAMSLVMLEVKPLDDTIDLDSVAKNIFASIKQDGLFWKTEYKKEPVAFGIFKLIVGFSLEDDKVSVDDIVEKIEGMEDQVQSVEIAAFNKI